MSNTTEIVIVNGARTPMGRYCGKLRDFTAMDLGAIASEEAMRRSGVEPAEIDQKLDPDDVDHREDEAKAQTDESPSKYRRSP